MKYIDLHHIASGTYCKVFLSRCLRNNQLVACKRFRDEPDSLRVIQSELFIMERLGRHPHIVRYLHHQKDEDGIFRLTMEYVEHDLERFLQTKNQTSSESDRLHIAQQLLTALEYCHNMFVLHRDVKPENILITDGGCVKLADFNLSCVHSPSAKSADVCTIYYRSPELFRASGGYIPYGPYIDIWAAGCVMAQLFSQAVDPVFFFDEDDLVKQHVLDEGYVSELHEVHELVEMSLQMKPLERSSASELLKFIDSVILG